MGSLKNRQLTAYRPAATQLLVSVRNASEAQAALAGGAAVIDIKEPERGALGWASPQVIEAILDVVAGRAAVSAALGELVDWPRMGFDVPARLTYAKFGLAGAAQLPDWSDRWQAALATLPAQVAPVAVAYADWRTCGAPHPEQVFNFAREFGSPALLVDTYDKSAGDLLAHWPLDFLETFVHEVQAAGLLAVLGGSLSTATIAQVLPLTPDYLAVRTAVCTAGRQSPLDPARVAQLAGLVASHTS